MHPGAVGHLLLGGALPAAQGTHPLTESPLIGIHRQNPDGRRRWLRPWLTAAD